MKARSSLIAAVCVLLAAPALHAQGAASQASSQANLHISVFVVPVVMNSGAQPSAQRVTQRSAPADQGSHNGWSVVFTLPSSAGLHSSTDQTVVRSWMPDPQPGAGRELAVLETTLYIPR